MIFRTLPRACSTMLSVLLLLTFSLPSTWSRVFAREGDPDGGPFNETVYYPWSLQQTDEGCSSGSSATLMSPNGNFTLKLNVVCPDRTMDPWNLSFVAGVGRRFPDLFQTDGTLQFPLQGWAWTVPVGFDQPTNSCALRFTATGDFQFVVPNLKRGDSPYPPWRQERILWRTNTSGLGAVEMQVQDSGNLVLVHADGKTVLWKALDEPLLPLSPLRASFKSIATSLHRLTLATTLVSIGSIFFLRVF